MEIFTVFILQVIFNIARSLGVMTTIKQDIFKTVILSIFIQITWLISTFLGINSLLKGDYIIIIFYIIGGAVGTYLSFKINNKIKER